MKSYDLAIIGSGPGGYVAALYASRHKLKACVIEKDMLGGTCLNKGCIPTKALLNSAAVLSMIKNASLYGIDVSGYSVDFPRVAARKDDIVKRLRTGIETLFRANKIDLVKGCAKLSSPGKVEVEGGDSLCAKNVIIAAGSRPMALTGMPFDGRDILSSDDILDLKAIPRSMAIIGGGVIGCEFANLFSSLGVQVSIIEFMDRLIPTQSRETSKKLESLLKKAGAGIYTSTKAEAAVKEDGFVKIKISGGKEIAAEKALISIGRSPAIEGLALQQAGVKVEGGRIAVDAYLRTAAANVYAIGDCVKGPQLAHKASYDGIIACDFILGKPREADYSNVPNCIWTEPEIASVGITEEEAKAKYPEARIAKFPYLASGKAFIEGKTDGFVKIIGNSRGDILGVEIFGKGACELIAEAVLAKSSNIKIGVWAKVVHGHPTLSEMLQEAAHIFCGTPIHSV